MGADDNRGIAVSAVSVYGSCTRVWGRLEDGLHIRYQLGPENMKGCDLFVGLSEPSRENDEPHFVKALLDSGDSYLMCSPTGFTMTYTKVDKSWVSISQDSASSSAKSPSAS